MDRYPSTSYPEVRFWCLQTLADAFRRDVGANADVLGALSDDDAARLRRTLTGWVAEAAERADPPVPPFVRNKLAQCVALVARAQFPAQWPRFTHDLLDVLATCRSAPASAANMFCRVLDAVDDEIVAGASGDARSAAAAARVKDAMRVDTEALRRLAEAWKALIAFPDTRVAVTATATARRYVDWMDVGLFVEGGVAGDSVARAARDNLGADDADRRAAACDFSRSWSPRAWTTARRPSSYAASGSWRRALSSTRARMRGRRRMQISRRAPRGSPPPSGTSWCLASAPGTPPRARTRPIRTRRRRPRRRCARPRSCWTRSCPP